MKEFGIEIHGYDPLLSKEEIEAFGVKSSANRDVKIDCVIVAVAHEEFKNNPFLKTFKKSFIKKASQKKAFSERNIPSFSQGFLFREKVVNNAPVLIDVRGMIDGEEARNKGFYYKRI